MQSIKDVAPGFSITDVSNEGVIEAIEKGNVVGVQWHPEALKDIDFFSRHL